MILRRYKPIDDNKISALYKNAMGSVGSYIDKLEVTEELDQDLNDIQNTYIENKGEFIVAEEQNKIIGMGALKRIDDTTAEIKRMCIEPLMQNQGIGGKILDKLIAQAKEYEYSRIILDVTETALPAQKLYESRGFKIYNRGELYAQKTLFYELNLK